jgi:23S rRNA (cytidine2498-2'-O)-methyltransferase
LRSSNFLFAACQPGAEALLKGEVARVLPMFRPAFSRPGLVTFKSPSELTPAVAHALVFARELGVSYGQLGDGEIAALARENVEKPPHLFVFAREPGEASAAEVARVEERLRGAATFATGPVAKDDLVIDVLVAPGEPLSVGAHTHGPLHAGTPGGYSALALPPEAPSRAYLKIEEAIRWSGARLSSGQVAFEIGSAPGGASFALLERGLVVHGVDPGEMADNVLASPRFVHHRAPVGALKKTDLPHPVHWFAMDMNLAPRVALRYAERVVMPLRRSLLGGFFTLKLNTPDEAADLPKLLHRIQGFGFARVAAKQLPSHRKEIVVVGFTENAGRRAKP